MWVLFIERLIFWLSINWFEVEVLRGCLEIFVGLGRLMCWLEFSLIFLKILIGRIFFRLLFCWIEFFNYLFEVICLLVFFREWERVDLLIIIEFVVFLWCLLVGLLEIMLVIVWVLICVWIVIFLVIFLWNFGLVFLERDKFEILRILIMDLEIVCFFEVLFVMGRSFMG